MGGQRGLLRAYGGRNHYTIAASAFDPDSLGGATGDYLNLWNPATLSNQENSRCFDAGLALPDGATLRSVTFYYTQGAADGLSLQINRQNLSAHKSRDLARLDPVSNGKSPVYSHKTVAITSGTVFDTSQYAYSAGVCPFGDATFSGLMINYTG